MRGGPPIIQRIYFYILANCAIFSGFKMLNIRGKGGILPPPLSWTVCDAPCYKTVFKPFSGLLITMKYTIIFIPIDGISPYPTKFSPVGVERPPPLPKSEWENLRGEGKHTRWENGKMKFLNMKNDDSVKEAPAYCRSFLDSLPFWKGGDTKPPYFNVL